MVIFRSLCRQTYLDQGLMPRLIQLMGSDDSSMRLNSLWAVKNLVRKLPVETRQEILEQIGWRRLTG
jgi:armadillo repeat-containing protein 8